jgi:HlyD family secretion protein
MNEPMKTSNGRQRLLLGGGGLVVLIILAFLLFRSSGVVGSQTEYYRVTRGPMEVTVTGAGTLRARNAEFVRVPDQVSGDLQLIYLIPEGSRVVQGQIVAQLDTAAALESLETQLDALETAQAQYDQQVTDLTDNIKNLENSVRSAELSYDQAQLRLQALEFSSALDRQAGELDLERARIQRDEAKRKLAAQKIINEANRRQSEVNLIGRRDDVEETRAEIKALTLRAPIPGLVIYVEQGRMMERTKIQEGDTVRRGQQLLQIPDPSVMEVSFFINELDADRVQLGQKARVRLEAYPREVFEASVTDLSTLAQDTSDGGNVRVFPAVVTLDQTDDRIRPGMTASVEIVVDTLEDALRIPLAALGVIGSGCCVKVVGRKDPVTVTLGARNESMVQVVDGLQQGNRIELGWREDTTGLLTQLAGRRALPEGTLRAIQAQGADYGKAKIVVQQEEGAPGPGGGRGQGRGGAGRQVQFDPANMTPEQLARIQQLQAEGAPAGGMPGAEGQAVVRMPGQEGGAGFQRATPDSARMAQFMDGLRQRITTLPDSLRLEVQQLIGSGSLDFRNISPALRDSLRAWNLMGGQRTRTPPPTGTPPPAVLDPTGGR